jgi:hypothetical protein
MSCPDWRALSPDSPATEAWTAAVAHFDGGCSQCRRDALKAEPTLVFRSLRSAPAASMGSTSMGSTDSASMGSIESMRQAVAAMRAASRVEPTVHHTAWKRWAVAAGLVLAALSIPADNVRKHPERAASGNPRPAAAMLGAVMPAALVGDVDLPTVEGVNHPDARVYHMDGEGLSVVMIVDESLDV